MGTETTRGARRRPFTVEEYMALDDDRRYEVLDGELIEMTSPNTRH